MRQPAPPRRATSAVPEAVPPPRATPDRLQYETRWPRILLTKGSRPSSQFNTSPRLSHARLFQVEVVSDGKPILRQIIYRIFASSLALQRLSTESYEWALHARITAGTRRRLRPARGVPPSSVCVRRRAR